MKCMRKFYFSEFLRIFYFNNSIEHRALSRHQFELEWQLIAIHCRSPAASRHTHTKLESYRMEQYAEKVDLHLKPKPIQLTESIVKVLQKHQSTDKLSRWNTMKNCIVSICGSFSNITYSRKSHTTICTHHW